MLFLTPSEYLPTLLPCLHDITSRLLHLNPNLDIQHIGSSAITGAISKGDLDVLIRVDKADFERTMDLIKSLGFYEKQGTLRTESLCMLETTQYPIDVAIQLIEKNSEFEFFITFRDIMNKDPKLVDTYNDIKRNSEHLTPTEYRTHKSKFIENVLGSRT